MSGRSLSDVVDPSDLEVISLIVSTDSLLQKLVTERSVHRLLAYAELIHSVSVDHRDSKAMEKANAAVLIAERIVGSSATFYDVWQSPAGEHPCKMQFGRLEVSGIFPAGERLNPLSYNLFFPSRVDESAYLFVNHMLVASLN